MLLKIFVWCGALILAAPFLSAQARVPEANLEDAIRNTPLLVARQSLQRARSLALDHEYAEAVSPLLATAAALAYFEQQEIGRNTGASTEAGNVRQQILDFATAIETDNIYAVSDIDGWLDQIAEWNGRRPAGNPSGRYRTSVARPRL
jgi:hypothetical protein